MFLAIFNEKVLYYIHTQLLSIVYIVYIVILKPLNKVPKYSLKSTSIKIFSIV